MSHTAADLNMRNILKASTYIVPGLHSIREGAGKEAPLHPFAWCILPWRMKESLPANARQLTSEKADLYIHTHRGCFHQIVAFNSCYNYY